MKKDKKGCSTCLPGEEQYEEYKGRKVQYDYRTIDGTLFSCVDISLENCRTKRNKWLIDETFKKFYEEQRYPECYNNSDMMDDMTVEDFKYNIVWKAFEAGAQSILKAKK